MKKTKQEIQDNRYPPAHFIRADELVKELRRQNEVTRWNMAAPNSHLNTEVWLELVELREKLIEEIIQSGQTHIPRF